MSEKQQWHSRMPIQIEHVRTALLRNYDGLIFTDDIVGYEGADWEQRFLSRALAAEAIRMMTGSDYKTAGRSVIDGERDQGIDALAIGDSSRDVWLVQAKWSDSGKARLDKAEALKFADGVRLVADRNFEPFNDQIVPFLARLDAAMGDFRLQIHLVVALMGADSLVESVTEVLERLCEDANVNGPLLRYDVLSAEDFHRRLREEAAPDPVNVTLTMRDWLRREMPFEAWQGTAAIRDIARWYGEHGDALYEQNVRKSLGITRINSGIKETLLKEPQNFWYFNNGITVLCDHIEPNYPGRRRGDEPVMLALRGVSVVNGAQTVTAISEAMSQDPDTADDADVTVRVFSLGEERPVYAKRITETTNTQNDVSERDFIALEPAQAEIREDFLLSLDKTYVYKRGEPDPAPDAGCSVVHAAIALACAYRSPELAVRAAKDTDLLWERGSRGAYPRLFGEVPSAYRIWRSVEVYRVVGTALKEEHKRFFGRAADMARRGEMLITYLVFQLIDQEGMDDPNLEWQPTLGHVPELTALVLRWLIYRADAEFGPKTFLSTTFNDETRCRQLAKLVLEDARRGGPIPDLPESYRPPARRPRKVRRPNAVPTLVSAGRLADGTPLTYQPRSDAELAAVQHWLAEDPLRARATWVNDRVKCLLWTYDEARYSASGLVQRIWELAGYEDAPVAVQGPGRWKLDSGLSLWELALQLLNDDAEQG